MSSIVKIIAAVALLAIAGAPASSRPPLSCPAGPFIAYFAHGSTKLTAKGRATLDNAISLESVKIKHIESPVAGRANVLVVPDLEAGNMLAKSLSFLAGADAAGIVLGARVPIILTSRADSVMTRLASCGIAVLVAYARREAASKAVPA